MSACSRSRKVSENMFCVPIQTDANDYDPQGQKSYYVNPYMYVPTQTPGED